MFSERNSNERMKKKLFRKNKTQKEQNNLGHIQHSGNAGE